MAIHSSILAWRIPWIEEPGRLQYRVRKSWTQLKQLSMHAGDSGIGITSMEIFLWTLFLLEYNCFTMLLVSAVQQSESTICIHILPPCSPTASIAISSTALSSSSTTAHNSLECSSCLIVDIPHCMVTPTQPSLLFCHHGLPRTW